MLTLIGWPELGGPATRKSLPSPPPSSRKSTRTSRNEMVPLDTNAYGAFICGTEDEVEIVRRADKIGFSTIVMDEFMAGFGTGSREKQNHLELSEFIAYPRVTLQTIDQETTEYYARTFRQLHESGRPHPGQRSLDRRHRPPIRFRGLHPRPSFRPSRKFTGLPAPH